MIDRDFSYRRPHHRARFTGDYVFSQLIPYIGNKRRLLPLIAAGIRRSGRTTGTFVDLFTGSTVVARMAKAMGFAVVANDWEPYSRELALGTVVPNNPPTFAALGGIEAVFATLDSLPACEGWVTRHLCPADDDAPDPSKERMFFTRENGLRIDGHRTAIASWENEGMLSAVERAVLLAALLYAACYVSNTSGVFKAYHNGWGGSTGTALYRIRSRLHLEPPVFCDNNCRNYAFREGAASLAAGLADRIGRRPDIVYIDPPYNQHPYGSNYHLLNTLTLWDAPPIAPSPVQNGRTVDKAAIRKDWRTRRSPFNHKSTALPALVELVRAIDAPMVLLSYSTDGIIPPGKLLAAVAEKGRLHVLTSPYKRYRVSSQRRSPKPRTVEYLVLVGSGGRTSSATVRRLAGDLTAQERELTDGR